MVNIRQKGASAERDIYNALNPIIQSVMRELNFPEMQILAAANCVQRNQNQTAVGGNDLTNTFGLSIEVKRQEALSINTWWKQTLEAANRNKEHPVLLYRQSRQAWKCITYGMVISPSGFAIQTRVEISWDDFLRWFAMWVRDKLMAGHEVRS